MHRSPGGVSCEASFPARQHLSDGPAASRIYTPAMRRWVCTVALLAGFVGEETLRGIRLRQPVAIVRLIDPRPASAHGLVPTGAWWSRRSG